MSKVSVAVVSLLVGSVVGAVVGSALVGGAFMGAGAATGMAAGICTTVQAAQQIGVMTPEQVDRVLAHAAHNLAGSEGVPEPSERMSSARACEQFMTQFKK